MQAVVNVLAAMSLLLFMPGIMGAISQYRANDYIEPHIVATEVGETSVNIVLSQNLFSGQTYNVSLSSDNSNDAPIPWQYTAATRTLTITGLEASTSRTMQITYKISALDDYFGADLIARIWPTLLVLGIIGLIGGGIYHATRRGDEYG